MSKDKYKHAMERIRDMEAGLEMEAWTDEQGGFWTTDSEPTNWSLDAFNDPNRIRTKPTPSKVPFGPEDITSDMWFAVNATHHKWLKASSLYSDGIALPIHAFVNYQQLREQFVYRRDGWEMNRTEKCEKPSPPPPKREPRRVFVNYYIGAEQIGVMHLSKEGAEAEANDEACEVAVEFVEVVK